MTILYDQLLFALICLRMFIRVTLYILGKIAPTAMKDYKKSESTKFKRTKLSIARKLEILEKHAEAYFFQA